MDQVLKEPDGDYWRETSLIVYLATLYGKAMVNIDISMKGATCLAGGQHS